MRGSLAANVSFGSCVTSAVGTTVRNRQALVHSFHFVVVFGKPQNVVPRKASPLYVLHEVIINRAFCVVYSLAINVNHPSVLQNCGKMVFDPTIKASVL